MEELETIKIPLFPLDAVLFPGGVLPLRIFEPRYLDMVSDCLKKECGIGVVLIKSGHESGEAAKVNGFGTLSYISYWHKRVDGMLGITLTGEQRFRILSSEIQANQSIIAEVTLLPTFETLEVEHQAESLVKLLKQIIAQLEPPYTTMTKYYDDLDWVSARLIELLPLELNKKQEMLLMTNLKERLDYLQPLLVSMEML
ncbi:MAG: LON peptidase substrate-binding domain-containing protein [Woeseiaceae bacterium]